MKTDSKTILPWSELKNIIYKPNDVRDGELTIQLFMASTYMPKLKSTKMETFARYNRWGEEAKKIAEMKTEDILLMHIAMVEVIARKVHNITGISEKEFLKLSLEVINNSGLFKVED